MGQYAEDIENGQCCSGCGTYFRLPHGYPVLCRSCHMEQKFAKVPENERLPRATSGEA